MGNKLAGLNLQSEELGSRLKEVRRSLGMTVEQFYRPLMKAFNNGSAIENGKRKLGKRLSKDIIEYHHINPGYLNTGKGEKTLSKKVHQNKNAHLSLQSNGDESVPYYDVNIAELTQTVDIFNESDLEYYVTFRPFNDCTAYLPVYGDSMYPRFVNGEIIAVKEIINPKVILWGEAYLVVTDEQTNGLVTVKLLHQHPDDRKIILRACNPDYKGDTVIDRTSIVKLYLIKGKITRNQL